MPEYQAVTDQMVQDMEGLRDRLKREGSGQKVNVRHRVVQVQLSHEVELDRLEAHEPGPLYHENEVVEFESIPSVIELLEFMAHRSLRDQVWMIANLLTISGYTQAEIAEALGVRYQTYRNTLLDIRKEYKRRT